MDSGNSTISIMNKYEKNLYVWKILKAKRKILKWPKSEEEWYVSTKNHYYEIRIINSQAERLEDGEIPWNFWKKLFST
jgi:hypothetical protein